jgi:trans-L-3-hydroxyproline dehydratase
LIALKTIKNFNPPPDWLEIQTIEAHTAGEPLRVILSGFPSLKGTSILSKRKELFLNHDSLRRSLMWEPRGHMDMYGALLVEPKMPTSDIGVIFMHNNGYSTGCGHAIIALTKIFVQSGAVAITKPITKIIIEAPSGIITAFAKFDDNKVIEVYFENVPSFVQDLDATVKVPNYGKIKYDLAYGGAFYAIINSKELGLELKYEFLDDIILLGKKIKELISKDVNCNHPLEPEMNDLYGIIFVDESNISEYHSKNICIFADGELDRSPTGTGVSARAAVENSRGKLDAEKKIYIESITGGTFSVSIKKTVSIGNRKGIIPVVGGDASIIGKNTFWIDPNDPLKDGFLLK